MKREKLKEAITKGRVYQCRLCGKQYIERTENPQCQHDFLLVELIRREQNG